MKEYNENSIKSLTDLEHVRLRPTIYVGDTKLKKLELPLAGEDGMEWKEYDVSLGYIVCVREILDNAIDIIRHTGKGTHVWIDYDEKKGKFKIKDNSVGVPIGKSPDDPAGRHTPQVVFETLRSGKNFETDEFIIGMNGMGASLTNFFSKIFKCTIYRDDYVYHQTWIDAVARKPIVKKEEEALEGTTGTLIEFQLNPDYFHGFVPSTELVRHLLQLTAMFNTDIKFKFNRRTLKTRGLKDFQTNGEFYKKSGKTELLVAPVYESTQDYKILTVVNGIPTFFGGSHADLIENGMLLAVKKELKIKGQMVHRTNILKGMYVIFQLHDVKNISFSSQAKTELITSWPDLGKSIEDYGNDVAKRFVKGEKEGWLKFIEDQFEKKKVKVQIARSKRKDNLHCHHAKNFKNAELYILEGPSAGSAMVTVRNDNQGILPLKGKILNVSERKLSEVVKSESVLSIIDMLKIDIEGNTQCPYEKIVIATDADPDGLHIQSLLITFFNYLAPELIDKIYILRAPLYVVHGKNRYNLYYDKESFGQAQTKGCDVIYTKGLGGLTLKEWRSMVDPDQRILIKLTNDSPQKLHKTINRLFAGDATYRRKWLGSSLPIYKIS